MWYPVAGTTVPYLRNCGTRLLEQWCNSGRNLQLFKVIADSSERGSTIVTTNLAFSEWTDLFENTSMVAAL